MLNQTDLSRADLNLLVLFEVVLEERHVGRAAERLNLTPSAVSHGLGRLRRLFNDPLFLRTPRGVTATARALDLASPVADVLARAREILATARPFDPSTSARRFTIGAPDGISAVFLPGLLARLRHAAPGIGIAIRQLLPSPGEPSPERAWRNVFTELDDRVTDISVVPSEYAPARFHAASFYEEDFVIAVRRGHPFADDPSLDRYCGMRHAVVSLAGDPYGFVDQILAGHGRSRQVALTVPNFMFALAAVADSDLASALPRRFVSVHAGRFGVIGVESPVPLTRFGLHVVAPRVAMTDAGVRWLFDLLLEAGQATSRTPPAEEN